MNASERICKVFDSLLRAGYQSVGIRSKAEQLVFVVVVARCEKDQNGFSSVFEQALDEREMRILTQGLHEISEPKLADAFAQIFEALLKERFYEHRTWNLVSDDAKCLVDAIEDRIGDHLWNLDDKLVALLDLSEAG